MASSWLPACPSKDRKAAWHQVFRKTQLFEACFYVLHLVEYTRQLQTLDLVSPWALEVLILATYFFELDADIRGSEGTSENVSAGINNNG